MAETQGSTNPPDAHQRRFRRVLAWLLVAGAPVLGIGQFWFLAVMGDRAEVRAFLFEHFAAIVGLPGAAVAAMFIVLMLEQTHGEIKFEVLQVKFRGASGPVVLWVLCYLAITGSIKLLW